MRRAGKEWHAIGAVEDRRDDIFRQRRAHDISSDPGGRFA
jgi:hypothetical protein